MVVFGFLPQNFGRLTRASITLHNDLVLKNIVNNHSAVQFYQNSLVPM